MNEKHPHEDLLPRGDDTPIIVGTGGESYLRKMGDRIKREKRMKKFYWRWLIKIRAWFGL